MTARPIVSVVVLSALLASAAEPSAQSLGDIARKEAERRGTAPAAGKTFTNDNLTPDFTKPEPPPVAATEPAKPAEGAVDGKADGAKAEELAGESVVDVASDPAEAAKWGVTPRDQQTSSQNDDQNEQYWRTTAAALKARLTAADERIAELRATLAATPKGAPGSEREIVERAFEKAQASQKYANQDWIRFEERARQRGIPEHWIR